MIFLDTDHLTVLCFPGHSRHGELSAHMRRSIGQDFGIPVVSVEEQLRGWLAEIAARREIRQQMAVYDRLALAVRFFQKWRIVTLDDASANRFADLRRQRTRIGTQDLKIASIALAHDALLLSANLRDFGRVPGLRVENWLI